MRWSVRLALAGACVGAIAGRPAVSAQPPDTEEVEVDALQCWRDVRASSVRVGQPFTMMVTCVAVETEGATTVPDETPLTPETIDLPPFEVVDGQRSADVRDGPWRTFQYQYTLRIIEEEHFGQDVEIPELELRYRVERRLDGGTPLSGRELRYVLPAEPIRIGSLVPEGATDIRGLPPQSLGTADTRNFRADLILLAAAAVGIVAFGFLVLAAVQLARQWRGTTPKAERLIANSVVVRRALSELTTLQHATAEHGWSERHISRILAALRLAAAAALSSPVSQAPLDRGRQGREGQLTIRRGFWRPRTTTLSASVTPETIAEEIARRRRHRPNDASLSGLDDLQEALRVFTAARYSPDPAPAADEMTHGLDKGINVVRDLRVRTLGPIQYLTRLVDTARGWWSERWAH